MRLLLASLTWPERILLAAGAAMLLAALLAPAVHQPAHYHDFADQRTMLGVPHACDVLSNLAFALAGVAGLWALRRAPAPAFTGGKRACANLFFAGLLLTAFGSAWYHLAPNDAGLAVDRATMSVAFAGLLALAAGRVSERADRVLAGVLLAAGSASVAVWYLTGNLLPWIVLQAGGMVLLLVVACLPARTGVVAVRWSLVLAAYVVAKLFELGDNAIFEATGQFLSGHTLKHLMAALTAWPIISVVPAPARGHNATDTPGGDAFTYDAPRP